MATTANRWTASRSANAVRRKRQIRIERGLKSDAVILSEAAEWYQLNKTPRPLAEKT
jgi:hypothetical protein